MFNKAITHDTPILPIKGMIWGESGGGGKHPFSIEKILPLVVIIGIIMIHDVSFHVRVIFLFRPMLERSLSATSTGSSSSSGPPSASFSGVYDNQLYQGDLVQYAQVEMGSDEIGSPKDPFSPPAISPGKLIVYD